MAPEEILNLIWRGALRRLFFALDPELAHRLVLTLLAAMPPVHTPADAAALAQEVWAMRFANPLGLAAGLDKNISAVGAWQSIGFGFAELGTITPLPQPGNPPPRLWRLPEHRALINRLGFPSLGGRHAADRLRRLRHQGVSLRLGINIGPNRATAPERTADDIAMMAQLLGPMADFIVINLSSPNTPGLREWQAPQALRSLIEGILARPHGHSGTAGPRMLIKIAPDLDDAQVGSICGVALELGIDGIVATNTTVARRAVGVVSDYPGGLSGAPLRELARGVIRAVYRHTQGKLPIVGVGGVASAEDAYGHIRAGASLVELYTGLIYEGPGLPAAIKRGLIAYLRRDGYHAIAEAVGTRAG
jgi:dihydroorotate dehydrogenase